MSMIRKIGGQTDRELAFWWERMLEAGWVLSPGDVGLAEYKSLDENERIALAAAVKTLEQRRAASQALATLMILHPPKAEKKETEDEKRSRVMDAAASRYREAVKHGSV